MLAVWAQRCHGTALVFVVSACFPDGVDLAIVLLDALWHDARVLR
jgi:hypothetical protein